MYKIIVFGIRDEEHDLANNWAKENNVELKLVSSQLSVDNVNLVEGFDGVSCSQNTKVPKEIYEELKKYGIKQISQRSAGYDYYDLEAASANDIIITNVPVYSPESIAEYSVTSALNMIRKNSLIQEHVSKNDFRWAPTIKARLVNELTVGIIGTGNIGRATARIFAGFGAKIIGYDLYKNEEAKKYLEYKDSVEEVVANSDIISLHVPATNDNYHQFNYEMFKKFKKDSVLVNAARGSVVDTEGLIKALDEGLLEAATLDTYENEGAYVPGNHEKIEDELFVKLLNHPKITFTPHIAFYTNVSLRNIMLFGLDNVLEVLETGNSKNRVN